MKRRDFLIGGVVFSAGMLMGKLTGAEVSSKIMVPAEEERHQATFMQWPVSLRVYQDRYFLEVIQKTVAKVANAIQDFEHVIMLADKADHHSARKLLASGVELWDIPTEDLWCRDSGAIFGKTADGKLVVSHIEFNGWGNKQIYGRDGKIAQRVAQKLGLSLIPSGLKGEGGGVEQDGHGLLLAHESSWVNDNRNPAMKRTEIERRLLDAYGAERMIWAKGLKGQDITDYHIDSLARFVGAGRVLMNLPDKPDIHDPFHQASLITYKALQRAKLKIEIIPEPVKRRVKSADFVASYVNYYVCNGAVIAAEFGDKETDDRAVKALKKYYPQRQIISLNVDALGEIGGGIHCATQQMPA